MVTSAKVSVGLESHASVAVGVTKDGVAGHWIVVGPGNAEITGGVVSLTVMVWVQVVVSAGVACESVMVQVRVMVLLQLEPWLDSVCTALTVSEFPQLSCQVTSEAAGTWL